MSLCAGSLLLHYATNAIGAEGREGEFPWRAVQKLGLKGFPRGITSTRVGGESESCLANRRAPRGGETFPGQNTNLLPMASDGRVTAEMENPEKSEHEDRTQRKGQNSKLRGSASRRAT